MARGVRLPQPGTSVENIGLAEWIQLPPPPPSSAALAKEDGSETNDAPSYGWQASYFGAYVLRVYSRKSEQAGRILPWPYR